MGKIAYGFFQCLQFGSHVIVLCEIERQHPIVRNLTDLVELRRQIPTDAQCLQNIFLIPQNLPGHILKFRQACLVDLRRPWSILFAPKSKGNESDYTRPSICRLYLAGLQIDSI